MKDTVIFTFFREDGFRQVVASVDSDYDTRDLDYDIFKSMDGVEVAYQALRLRVVSGEMQVIETWTNRDFA